MARFMADVQGTRGPVSRLGDARNGIESHTRGWEVGVRVIGRVVDGEDEFEVWATSGSSGAAAGKLIGVVYLDRDTCELQVGSRLAQ